MKRLLWVLLPLLLLTGCGREEAPETEPPILEVEIPYVEETEAPRPYEGVKLTFGSIWQEEEPQTQVLLQAAETFEKKTGAVVSVLWPEEDGNADIFQMRGEEFFSTAVEPLNLTELAEQSGYFEKSYSALTDQVTAHCGYLGAVAQVPYLGGVYYNADAFTACGITEAPATWEEFVQLSRILRANGWEPLTLDKEDAVAAMELHLRRYIGMEEMHRLMGKKGQWHFEQAVTDAMEQVMLYVQEGNMTYGTPAEFPTGQNKMGISNSAMMVGTNEDCAAVEAATLTSLHWGVFPYPGEKESGTWATADVVAIDPACENPQAAFDFVMLLTTGEFDQLLADITGGIPADPSNTSSIAGAVEALQGTVPQPLGIFGSKQTDAAVKLWSGWYESPNRYAIVLERSKY